MSPETLKPCPFCGSANVKSEQNAPIWWAVSCENCSAQLYRPTRFDAEASWNTRAATPAGPSERED